MLDCLRRHSFPEDTSAYLGPSLVNPASSWVASRASSSWVAVQASSWAADRASSSWEAILASSLEADLASKGSYNIEEAFIGLASFKAFPFAVAA